MAQSTGGIGRRQIFTGAAATVGATAVAGLLGNTPAVAATDLTAQDVGARDGAAPDPIRVTSADQQYPELVRGVNQRYVGSPEAVYVIHSTDQVAGVVQQAVSAGKRITVSSSGHCLEDFVFNPDVEVVLDLSPLDRVSYDPDRNAVAVETGAALLDVYHTLYQNWGVTIPAGICYSVAAGGHVSGGGWGLLCRQQGLVIDHLYAVEVVVVDQSGAVRTVVATREADDPHRDLWWAHAGGGGGNFGIVTRYWFRSPGATGNSPKTLLPKPPSSVYLLAVSWPWAQMTQDAFSRLVANYASYFVANNAPGNPRTALASFLVLTHQSAGQIGMVTQVDATVPGARQMLDDYLAALNTGVGVQHTALTRPMAELTAMEQYAEPRLLPWFEATKYLGTTNANLTDSTLRQEYKSAYMADVFPARHLSVMYKYLSQAGVAIPGASVTLSSYGGQVNATAPDATAYPHRESAFKMMWMSRWADPTDDATYIAWNRAFYSELYSDTGGVPVPNGTTDGCYVNYPDADLSDPQYNRSATPWSALYYKGNYAALQQVKKEYDPLNVFRHRQSVELPS
ncbi:FAD-binding oxidoreductase [Streptacidiphilus anmyonensis]|uniref:FAD-binding oxidoreductase n=1 Tax=Streptacidiphilus anmyonensis TaxID=405782 RepID=UPI00191C65DA|nr:FAD-binding oxidoreductase [Streptacidiphilus anmyonensis]